MAKDRNFERIPGDPNSPFRRGKNYLVLIGIDAYHYVGKLSNAVRDARAFRDLLLEKYCFEREFLTEFYDDQATFTAIDETLRNLASKIQEGDNLILYFSGHGHYDAFYNDGYWIPVDARYDDKRGYFSYRNIVAALDKIPTQHTFLVVDSCYSGAYLVENTRRFGTAHPREKDPSRWILASGRNEVVPDGIAGGNSPFAEQLLDVLERYADEGIFVLDLVAKVTTATNNNAKQIPIGRPIQNTGDKGGQFYFYPKNYVPTAQEQNQGRQDTGTMRNQQESHRPAPDPVTSDPDPTDPLTPPPSSGNKSYDKVKILLAENQTMEALNLLYEILPERHKNDVILLKGELNGLKRDNNMRLLSPDEFRRGSARVRASAMELCDLGSRE